MRKALFLNCCSLHTENDTIWTSYWGTELHPHRICHCRLWLFTSLTAISAIPSRTAASSTACQLLTRRTNQEFCQSASEFPSAVPSLCTLTHTLSRCSCWLCDGVWTPLIYHSSSSDDQLRGAELQEASPQGCGQTVSQDLIPGSSTSKLALKLHSRLGEFQAFLSGVNPLILFHLPGALQFTKHFHTWSQSSKMSPRDKQTDFIIIVSQKKERVPCISDTNSELRG